MAYYYAESFPRDYWRMESEFMHLYPPLYHEIYPVAGSVIDEMDDPWRYPVPPRYMVDEMVEECYRRLRETGIIQDIQSENSSEELEGRQYYRRRDVLRTLLGVILLNELLRRRRRLFF